MTTSLRHEQAAIAARREPSVFRRLIREPLLHFLALAALIFVAYDMLDLDREPPDAITVSAAQIEHLGALFARTFQRPPTADELKGLIDDHVKEEIYYREARKLGLDQDDTVIRRRLRQKMEFLTDASVDALVPADAELEAYLQANPAAFEVEPSLAIDQIFFSPERRGGTIEQDAGTVLNALRTQPPGDLDALGDPTLLPRSLPLTPLSLIVQTFGPDFAAAASGATPGQWNGPVRSGYGLHLIRVTRREAGRAPELPEVRGAVTREWLAAKRRELESARLNGLLERYPVTIETASPANAAQ